MGAGAVRAGRAFVEFFGDDSKLTKALQTNEKRLKAWGANVAKIGAGALAAGSAVLAPLIAASKVFDSMGSQMADVANRTGASVEALSSFGYAAEQTGASLESVESGLRFLAKSGLAAGMNVDDAFRAALKTIASIDDPLRRAETAMTLFGKSGTALIPMAMELESLEKRASELGLVMSTEDANAADTLGDAWGELTAVAKALVFQVGAALAPAMIAAVTAAAEAASRFIGWVRVNRELIVTVAKVAAAVAVVGAGLVAVGGVLSGIGAVLGAASAAVAAFGSALAAVAAAVAFIVSPIGLAIAGLAGLTVWFFTATETGRQAVGWLVDAFAQLKDFVGRTFKGIKDALTAGDITLAAEVLWASLRVAWLTGTNFLTQQWQTCLQGMLDAMVPVAKGIANILVDAMFAAGKAIAAVMEATGLDKLFDPSGKIFGNIKAILADSTGMVRGGLKMAAGMGISGFAADFKSGSNDKITASQQALDEARQRFAEAQQKAADEAVNAASGRVSARPMLSIPELTAGMDQAKAAVSGTFSAAAAAGLGGDRQLDTIAGNTGTTNKLLSKIAGKQAGLMVT